MKMKTRTSNLLTAIAAASLALAAAHATAAEAYWGKLENGTVVRMSPVVYVYGEVRTNRIERVTWGDDGLPVTNVITRVCTNITAKGTASLPDADRLALGWKMIVDQPPAVTNLGKRVVATGWTETETEITRQYAEVDAAAVNATATATAGGKVYETNDVRALEFRAVKNRYSKLKIVVAAKAAGKWDALKAGIAAADLEDEWAACQYIEDGDPAFVSATNAVVAAGVATAEEIAAFLKLAIDN